MKNIDISDKKFLFVTGTRADFGKLEPLAKVVLELGAKVTFFVTGMHMMKQYGDTRIEVHKLQGASVFEYVNQRASDPLDLVLAKTVLGLSDFVHERKPDLVVIHGDRVEALGASLVCATNNIRSLHVEGGELSGTIDESFRHCNTKLCTVHAVSSECAAKRIMQFGEERDRVFTLGSPEMDIHAQPSSVLISQVKSYYQIDFEQYGIIIFHPVTSELGTIKSQALNLFKAAERSNKNFVVILPNNDPGSDSIVKCIDALPNKRFRVLPSMRFNYFSELMKNSKIIIGNSSVGVREAPFLGIQSINIGSRQNNRSHAQSILNLSGEFESEILVNIESLWGKIYQRNTVFGDGKAAENFKAVVRSPSFWTVPLQKKFNSQE